MKRSKILFTTEDYNYLAEEITSIDTDVIESARKEGDNTMNFGSFITGIITKKVFPDGEVYHKIDSNVDGADVVYIAGTPNDADWLEILDVCSAMVKYGAHTLTVIIPFMSYSTMERAVKKREVVKAKTRTRILSMIPKSHRNKFIFMDLHVDTIPHYLEGNVVAEELKCDEIIRETAKEMAGGNDFVFASADLGRVKQISNMANSMGVSAAFVSKERKSGSDTEIKFVVGADVKDKKVIIYDDMIRTGGSLIDAGKVYRDAGASEAYAIATHGVFPGWAAKKIQDSGVFEYVATTNSHPRASLSAATEGIEGLQIKSIAEMLYRKIISL